MKLLRVLQTGEFQRLGSNTTRKTDVRLISATNANLTEAIRSGTVPRGSLLSAQRHRAFGSRAARSFRTTSSRSPSSSEEHASADNRGELVIGREAMQAMLDHEWPGNVRELDNRIQRAVLVAKSATITAVDLGLTAGPEGQSAATVRRCQYPRRATRSPATSFGNKHRSARRFEQMLTEARGVVSKAAAQLGVSRQALYRRMERLGIELERGRRLEVLKPALMGSSLQREGDGDHHSPRGRLRSVEVRLRGAVHEAADDCAAESRSSLGVTEATSPFDPISRAARPSLLRRASSRALACSNAGNSP